MPASVPPASALVKRVFPLALLAATSLAIAEGPGSRLRTTPEVPATAAAPAPRIARCEQGGAEHTERCKSDSRDSRVDRKPSGPEKNGMGSGAGSSASSGTTGGGSFGGSAPR
jgi:uncharacterized membrane protein YgcG